MSIAYFIENFPATSETFVINEIDELSRQNEEVCVISLESPTAESLHTLGAQWKNKTIYLDKIKHFHKRNLLAMLRLAFINPVRFVRAVIKSKNFDSSVQWRFRHAFWLASRMQKSRVQHIHAHFACGAAKLAWVVNWLTGIPFSVSTHGYDIYVKPYRFMAALSADASFIRSVCKYNMRALRDMGVPPNKIPVIHCGIRAEQFSPSKNIEKDIDIVCVARLHPGKGHIYIN